MYINTLRHVTVPVKEYWKSVHV